MSWVSHRLIMHNDPNTSLSLNVYLESGVFVENVGYEKKNYVPVRLMFQIVEFKKETNYSKIELNYPELVELNSKISRALRKLDILYDNKEKITIAKYTAKAKKLLTFTFKRNQNKEGGISIKIDDQNGSFEIMLSFTTFLTITEALSSMVSNFPVVSTNMMIISNQERILESLDRLGSIQPIATPRPERQQEKVIATSSADDFDIVKEEPKVAASSGFDVEGLDLDALKTQITDGITDGIEDEVSDDRFFRVVLKNDLTNLKSWTTSVLCTGKDTEAIMFSPLYALLRSSMSFKDFSELEFRKSFFSYQATLLKEIKDRSLKYVSGESKGFGIIPNYSLNFTTSESKKVFRTALELFTTLVIYSKIAIEISRINNYEVKNDADGYIIAQFILNSTLSPLIKSISENYRDKFLMDALNQFISINESSIMTKISTEFNQITGKNLSISVKEFEIMAEKLINSAENNKDIEVFQENITNIEDVRDFFNSIEEIEEDDVPEEEFQVDTMEILKIMDE